MSELTGKVSGAHSRDWKNGIKFYHFTLEGSPNVHNCGSVDPNVEVGEWIKFTETNRKVVVPTIERVAPGTRAAPQSTAQSGSASEGPAQSAVGVRIQRQAARHDAILLVTAAMANNLLPIPKSGKGEDKWARLLDLIDETTNDLIEQEGEWTKRAS